MISTEIVGWIGTVLLSCCGIPQVIAATKNDIAVRGITYWYLFGWVVGISCMVVYIHYTGVTKYQYPLQIANLVSLTCGIILACMKYQKERK